MKAKIVRLRPKQTPLPTLQDLVEKVREHANEGRIGFDHPHVKERMATRGLTMRQVLEVARKGDGISGPTLDRWGDWRVKMKRLVAGRKVQIVVAVRESECVVVTVI
jgi:hypothetical protein